MSNYLLVSMVMCILSYVVYCSQVKTLSYGSCAYYPDGAPTPTILRSSWDFIPRKPRMLVDFQQ